jgi:hypothetical protein
VNLPSSLTERGRVPRRVLGYAALFGCGYLSVVAYQAFITQPGVAIAGGFSLPAPIARAVDRATNVIQTQHAAVPQPLEPAVATAQAVQGDAVSAEVISVNNYPDISVEPEMQAALSQQRDEYFQSTSYAIAHDTNPDNRRRFANQLREMLAAPDADPRLNQLLESLAGDADPEVASIAREGLNQLAARRR